MDIYSNHVFYWLVTIIGTLLLVSMFVGISIFTYEDAARNTGWHIFWAQKNIVLTMFLAVLTSLIATNAIMSNIRRSFKEKRKLMLVEEIHQLIVLDQNRKLWENGLENYDKLRKIRKNLPLWGVKSSNYNNGTLKGELHMPIFGKKHLPDMNRFSSEDVEMASVASRSGYISHPLHKRDSLNKRDSHLLNNRDSLNKRDSHPSNNRDAA
jgi:hypothetical protein